MEDAVRDPHDELVLDGAVALRADLDHVRHLEIVLFPLEYFRFRRELSPNTWRSQHWVTLRKFS